MKKNVQEKLESTPLSHIHSHFVNKPYRKDDSLLRHIRSLPEPRILWLRMTRGSGKRKANIDDRAEKRLRMRAVDSFWRIFDRLISERLAP